MYQLPLEREWRIRDGNRWVPPGEPAPDSHRKNEKAKKQTQEECAHALIRSGPSFVEACGELPLRMYPSSA